MKKPAGTWRIRAKGAAPDGTAQKARREEIAALLTALFPPVRE